jgi:lysophospholipase L1-like esterase
LGFDTEHIMADISQMVSIAQQKKKHIILETLTPAYSGAEITKYSDQQINDLIAPVDARILALGLPVADCNKVLRGVSGALSDGLHPSYEGYKLLSAEVERAILSGK